MYRPIEGEIKTCTLRQNASGDWNASFSCEIEVQPLPHSEKAIGIDVGLEHFATFSNGKKMLSIQATPYLLELKPGTHITAVGAHDMGKQELDASVFDRSDLIVADIVAMARV